ncbi:MAG TPA: regulatory iron-sulfur-containing complex subunit RicT [Pirellulaceae bacterium]|nr:regulatory iron-sulfur-containing complex subunit RicT [Pirellulaceae bacterium]
MPRYIVRFGAMRELGAMSSRQDAIYRRGAEVVVRSPRGMEIGQVLCEATENALRQMERYASGTIWRAVTSEDALQMSKILGLRPPRIATCERLIEELQLPMKLVDIEQLLGGERVIVYYVSEERIDFRELVKRLAGEFQTRVEMHQIGVRDEAKLLADYGDCGKPVCCNTHLAVMPPVSMKMAKLQKATLDPSKISGRCGRLKCCLRYEFDTYEALHEELPPIGSSVVTSQGRCKVIGQEILSQHLLVETEDHRRLLIEASEVLSRIGSKQRSGQAE